MMWDGLPLQVRKWSLGEVWGLAQYWELAELGLPHWLKSSLSWSSHYAVSGGLLALTEYLRLILSRSLDLIPWKVLSPQSQRWGCFGPQWAVWPMSSLVPVWRSSGALAMVVCISPEEPWGTWSGRSHNLHTGPRTLGKIILLDFSCKALYIIE